MRPDTPKSTERNAEFHEPFIRKILTSKNLEFCGVCSLYIGKFFNKKSFFCKKQPQFAVIGKKTHIFHPNRYKNEELRG